MVTHKILIVLPSEKQKQSKPKDFFPLSETTQFFYFVSVWTGILLKISLRHFIFHMIDQLPFCIFPNSVLKPWCISSSCITCGPPHHLTWWLMLLNRKDSLLLSFYRNTYYCARKGRMYKYFLYFHSPTGYKIQLNNF